MTFAWVRVRVRVRVTSPTAVATLSICRIREKWFGYLAGATIEGLNGVNR